MQLGGSLAGCKLGTHSCIIVGQDHLGICDWGSEGILDGLVDGSKMTIIKNQR